MIFHDCAVAGAHVIDVEPADDDRGFFARTWSSEEMSARGLASRLDECSLSYSRFRHTLRGMHYQVAPFTEAKVVACRAGAIHDVIVDLRPESPTYRKWTAVVLSASNRRMLYVPPMVAHGFLTLEDDSEVEYLISGRHSPEHARGVRHDDPSFAIEWPARPAIVSDRDRRHPDFSG